MESIQNMEDLLTQQVLKELLDYSPETGQFAWKVKPANWIPIGSPAGSRNNGYIEIRVRRRLYYAHRLAFLYMTGELPKDSVDHINGKRDDNRWINIRRATHAENMRNAALSKNNKSGVTGVYWDAVKGFWVAKITVNRKDHFLGHFTKVTDAAAARKAAEKQYGFHPNHGRRAA
jgi:hypothetical protein